MDPHIGVVMDQPDAILHLDQTAINPGMEKAKEDLIW